MTHDSGHAPTSLAPKKRLGPAGVGLAVLGALLALTLVEYGVFLAVSRNLPFMIVMNVADAALIMVYFMHVARALRREED